MLFQGRSKRYSNGQARKWVCTKDKRGCLKAVKNEHKMKLTVNSCLNTYSHLAHLTAGIDISHTGHPCCWSAAS